MGKKTKASIPQPADVKYDLGCGRNKQPGFIGVDLYSPDADIKADLMETPWKFAKDNSASEIFASHFLEHIPHGTRWRFMEECYRVLKPEGIMRIFVPNWKSERAYGDMTHQWPPVVAMFFFYLHRPWREANKLNYGPYDLKCNFEHAAGPTSISPDFSARAHEAQVFACTHYMESYMDMWVTLTKKPMDHGLVPTK